MVKHLKIRGVVRHDLNDAIVMALDDIHIEAEEPQGFTFRERLETAAWKVGMIWQSLECLVVDIRAMRVMLNAHVPSPAEDVRLADTGQPDQTEHTCECVRNPRVLSARVHMASFGSLAVVRGVRKSDTIHQYQRRCSRWDV